MNPVFVQVHRWILASSHRFHRAGAFQAGPVIRFGCQRKGGEHGEKKQHGNMPNMLCPVLASCDLSCWKRDETWDRPVPSRSFFGLRDPHFSKTASKWAEISGLALGPPCSQAIETATKPTETARKFHPSPM